MRKHMIAWFIFEWLSLWIHNIFRHQKRFILYCCTCNLPKEVNWRGGEKRMYWRSPTTGVMFSFSIFTCLLVLYYNLQFSGTITVYPRYLFLFIFFLLLLNTEYFNTENLFSWHHRRINCLQTSVVDDISNFYKKKGKNALTSTRF